MQSATDDPFQPVCYTADDAASASGGTFSEMSMSGSGVVDLADGPDLFVQCELNNGQPRAVSWGTNAAEPIQVTITPVSR